MRSLTVKIFFQDLLKHFLLLTVISIIYYFMLTYPRNFDFKEMLLLVIAIPVMILGISYYILFYHLFFRKILAKNEIKNLLPILLLLCIGYLILDNLILNFGLFFRYNDHKFIWFSQSSIIRFFIFTLYAIIFSYVRGFSWLRDQKNQSDKEKSIAIIKNLRSKIEPHFILNSLNTVYALSLEEKAKKTSQSIEELSSLFKYSLIDSDFDRVPIQAELEFIEKYVHLNTLRIHQNKNVKIDFSINWDKLPCEIAPMIIITFVENAFKFGISYKRDSNIKIEILVKNRTFKMIVKNTVHHENLCTKFGIGIKNTRARLDLLYKNSYTMVENIDEFAYELVLTINLDSR